MYLIYSVVFGHFPIRGRGKQFFYNSGLWELHLFVIKTYKIQTFQCQWTFQGWEESIAFNTVWMWIALRLINCIFNRAYLKNCFNIIEKRLKWRSQTIFKKGGKVRKREEKSTKLWERKRENKLRLAFKKAVAIKHRRKPKNNYKCYFFCLNPLNQIQRARKNRCINYIAI